MKTGFRHSLWATFTYIRTQPSDSESTDAIITGKVALFLIHMFIGST
jgi:hypothetical protein